MEQRRMTKQQKASKEKKQRIFSNALELFQKYGYDNVTVAEIAEKSEISEGSIYNFFGSKAGILSDTINYVLGSTYDYITVTEEHLADPKNTMMEYMLAQGKIFERLGWELSQKFYSVAMQNGQVPYDSSYASVMASLNPDMVEFVQAAKEKGTLKTDYSAEEIVAVSLVLRYGLVLTWTQCSGSYNLLEASETAFNMEFRALGIN
ncbi:MAG: TetR/AcrR family transcriptional regulator [Clostridia bacterium]|nr:TetR/AcrR family transcriptional regulator [Clostridia bacterium]